MKVYDCKCSGIEMFGTSRPCAGCIKNSMREGPNGLDYVEKFHARLDAGWMLHERGAFHVLPQSELRLLAPAHDDSIPDDHDVCAVADGTIWGVWKWADLVWVPPGEAFESPL